MPVENIMERPISPPPRKRRKVSPKGGENDEENLALRTLTAPQAEQNCIFSLAKFKVDTLRIFSWNINGIAPFLQKPITSFFKPSLIPKEDPSSPMPQQHISPTRNSLREFLKRHRWPQIVCLQEVKINAQDEKTKASVRRAINGNHVSDIGSLSEKSDGDLEVEGDDDKYRYDAHFCLPRDKHNARGFGGKLYGVCTLIRSDFAHDHVLQVREVDWDLEGRILVVELQNRTAIFNIYAVNGTDNPYRDPSTSGVIGTRHDRKLAFHRLLLEECLAMEKNGWKLVLVGDFNVAREELDGFPHLRTTPYQHVVNRADFNNKFFEDKEGLRAVDTWRHVHGRKKGYTYYPRGRDWGSSCDRVDLILVSKIFVAEECAESRGMNLLNAGIEETIEERGPSDHVPLWVELSNFNK
jgi:exonuclease III